MQDATEIKVRKTDYHVMCTVTGNLTQDILTLKVNDLTSFILIYFFVLQRDISTKQRYYWILVSNSRHGDRYKCEEYPTLCTSHSWVKAGDQGVPGLLPS